MLIPVLPIMEREWRQNLFSSFWLDGSSKALAQPVHFPLCSP
jgi:hypothetical protein